MGLALIAVVAVIVFSGNETSSTGNGGAIKLPSPKDLPSSTVALVTHVPGKRGTISIADLHHSMELSSSQTGLRAAPKPGQPKYKKTEEAALASLFDQKDVQGQAQEMGISVTPKKVISQFELIRRKSFKSEAQYAAFLKKSHLTQSDVLERIEVQLLTTAIQAKIIEGITGKAAQQKAFSKFASAFSQRWRSRTVCAPRYAVAGCSNGPPVALSSGAAPRPAP